MKKKEKRQQEGMKKTNEEKKEKKQEKLQKRQNKVKTIEKKKKIQKKGSGQGPDMKIFFTIA